MLTRLVDSLCRLAGRLTGRHLEQPDAQWQALNPTGFTYGAADGKCGGAHMQEAGVAELKTAPNEHFLNRYCTSSIAEDKAEVRDSIVDGLVH